MPCSSVWLIMLIVYLLFMVWYYNKWVLRTRGYYDCGAVLFYAKRQLKKNSFLRFLYFKHPCTQNRLRVKALAVCFFVALFYGVFIAVNFVCSFFATNEAFGVYTVIACLLTLFAVYATMLSGILITNAQAKKDKDAELLLTQKEVYELVNSIEKEYPHFFK